MMNGKIFTLILILLQIPGWGKWYRGNTHTHTVLSGHGEWEPEKIAQWFYDHDYHFLGLTEHNKFIDPKTVKMPDGSEGKFLLVPSEEVTGKNTIHTSAINISELVNSSIYNYSGTRTQNIRKHQQGVLPKVDCPS